MTTSQHQAVVVEGDFDILIIHGVGNPVAGDLVRTVKETLRRASLRGSATIRIAECNWNQIVEPSARGGVILASAWEDLSMSLAHASAIGDGLLSNNRSARLLRVLSGLALMFAELGLAATLAAILMVVPLLLTFSVLVNKETLWTVGIREVLAFALESMIVALGALALLVLSGLTRTLVMGAWAPFFVELRRALLVVLRPFLISGTYLFLAPWLPWRRTLGDEWKVYISMITINLVMMVPLARWLYPQDFKWSEFGFLTLVIYGVIFGIGAAVVAVAYTTVRIIAPRRLHSRLARKIPAEQIEMAAKATKSIFRVSRIVVPMMHGHVPTHASTRQTLRFPQRRLCGVTSWGNDYPEDGLNDG